MKYKINDFTFVFSFVFLIGVGVLSTMAHSWISSIFILLLGAFGYYMILSFSEELNEKK